MVYQLNKFIVRIFVAEMTKHWIGILLSLFISSGLHAQYRSGMSMSNFSGSHGLKYNPARVVGSPLSWDANLFSLGLFLDNSWASIPNNSIFTMLNKELIFIPSGIPRTNLSENAYILLNTNKKFNNFTTDISIQGPSFMASTHDKGFAFFINVRTNISIRNIDDDFAHLMATNFNFLAMLNKGVTIERMKINIMSWTELGATYGYTMVDASNIKIKGAISPKFLISPIGASVRLNQLVLPKPDLDATLQQNLDKADIELGYGLTNYDNFMNGFGVTDALGGLGIGADVGILIESQKLYKSKRKTYKQKYEYQVGVGLIDFGGVFFLGGIANKVTETEEVTTGVDDEGPARLLSNFTDRKGVPTILLPTAATSHIDISLKGNFYAQGRIVLGMPPLPNQLRAPHAILVAARYESRHFDFALPVTIHDFRHTRVGFSMRLAILTIGSDNLTNLFVKNSEITGTDFYVGIRLYRNRRDGKGNTFVHKALRKKKTKTARKRFKMASPRF